jgi:hypothetical protein
MYYVLKLDGVVVNIVRCDTEDLNVCLPLVEGKCDTIHRAANLEDLIFVLKEDSKESLVADPTDTSATKTNHVDQIVKKVTDKAEAFINDFCDQITKAKKGDIQSIVEKAKTAGKIALEELRKQAAKKKK